MKNKRYRCSPARIEALERLQGLMAGAKSASKRSIPAQVREMTYQSAIFQASSTLEEYLKQIFDHWLFELKNSNSSGDKIPTRARFSYLGRQFHSHFCRYISEGDEKILAERLISNSNVIDFAMGRSAIFPYITGEFVYKDRKYPSPENIKKLYSRIGCDNIFDRISAILRSDAELKLRGFNDVRTAIAHGLPPSLTIIDVKRNLDDVASFIKSLDKINHKEFAKHFGAGVW